MSDLSVFLLARIAEDEVRARDLGADAMMGARWKHHPKDAYDDLQQMALNYSRRVLAECEAKRRIVEQLQRHERLIVANSEKHTEASRGGLDNQEQITALRTHGWELSGRLEALRMAVDALVAVYADHEDFKEEWR